MTTLREQRDALSRGEVSSVELTTAALARAHDAQERLNAFVAIADDAALAAARDADARRAAGDGGPLLGVPIVVKDDVDAAGHVTSWGSAAFTRPAPADSPLATALRGAGVVEIGRTTLPEIAACGFTESDRFGVTRNPVDPSRTPGGSSGGSAAAVADGVVTLGTASDGAGSIRIPAACCGLPGFKPTAGTMPTARADGAPGWHGLSVLGCLTRTLADAAVFYDTIGTFGAELAGAEARDPRTLRIGVDVAPFPMAPPVPLDPDVAGTVRHVADLLADLGHRVEPVRLPTPVASVAASARYLRSLHDAAAEADDPAHLERRTREMARLGGLVPAGVLGAAERAGRRWGARVMAAAGLDVLLTPTMRGPAPEVGRWAGRGGFATLMGMGGHYAHTAAWNHTGQPALTLPARATIGGLPLAVQLVAPRGEDATLLALGGQTLRALASAR